ncbi:MAG: signal peptidase I [Acidimicrobiales bacterium]
MATDPFQAGPAVGGASTVSPSGVDEGAETPAAVEAPPDMPGDTPGGDGSGRDAPIARAEARRRRRKRAIIEWVIVLVVALGVAVGMRTFVVQTFYIPSGSMEPTLNPSDRILVDKLSYHLHAVHRGDIIVFARPPGETLEPGVNDLVKRVIGLPGETISGQNGQVYINGKPLAEPWLPKGVVTGNFSPVHIPQSYYFVMGDNRGFSSDSRVFGPISGSLIVGRVVMRIWPLSHITIF